jgi:hypothetical protein
MKVFLVLGNHKFYNISRGEDLRNTKSLERKSILKNKLVILHRMRVNLNMHLNIIILDCTLQSHIFSEARQIVKTKIKDFKRIIN